MDKIKSWFDPKINIGHLLIIFSLLISGLALWRNAAVASVEVEARVKVVEATAARHEATLSSIADKLLSISVNQASVTTMLTEHLRTHPTPKP